jgi:prepilin signal peptidase PulO-like enzyme (type II secretory pathway)
MTISRFILLFFFGIVISYIDVRTRTIPNRLNLLFLILSLAIYGLHRHELPGALVTASFFALIFGFTLLLRRKGMGGGDMKLIVVLALLLGTAGRALSAVILAGTIALVQIGALSLKNRRRSQSIAFAPALFIGALLSLG